MSFLCVPSLGIVALKVSQFFLFMFACVFVHVDCATDLDSKCAYRRLCTIRNTIYKNFSGT